MARKQAFTHDYGARNDIRLMNVRMHLGMAGIGIYWCIVESLFEQGGKLPVAMLATMAFDFNEDVETIRSVVYDFGLFDTDGKMFWSPSGLRRIAHRKKVSDARSQAGKQGVAVRFGKQQKKPEQQNAQVATPVVPVEPVKPQPTPEQKQSKVKMQKRFIPPTIEEVKAENERKGYHIDAESFIAFYESKGWLVGKTPMRSWKAAMVTWEKRNVAQPAAPAKRPASNNNVNDIWK